MRGALQRRCASFCDSEGFGSVQSSWKILHCSLADTAVAGVVGIPGRGRWPLARPFHVRRPLHSGESCKVKFMSGGVGFSYMHVLATSDKVPGPSYCSCCLCEADVASGYPHPLRSAAMFSAPHICEYGVQRLGTSSGILGPKGQSWRGPQPIQLEQPERAST